MTHASNFRDLTGLRFGRLTAIRYAGQETNRGARWLWRCDCGTEFETYGGSVTRGHTRSCGCLRKEISARNLRLTNTSKACVVIDPRGTRHAFASRTEAAAWLGVSCAHITRHANGGTIRNHKII